MVKKKRQGNIPLTAKPKPVNFPWHENLHESNAPLPRFDPFSFEKPFKNWPSHGNLPGQNTHTPRYLQGFILRARKHLMSVVFFLNSTEICIVNIVPESALIWTRGTQLTETAFRSFKLHIPTNNRPYHTRRGQVSCKKISVDRRFSALQ